VVTQPDKPQGRSRKVLPPPVKQIALEEKIPVYQPASPKDEEFIDAITTMAPDISVVVAYGHILPRRIIDLPKLGTLNIHASLLPQLRGAAPIQAAIRQGFTETGVTIMRMVPALDAGPIILSAAVPILEDETYGELQNRLSELGALTLLESLALIGLGAAVEQAQDDSRATYAPKVTRENAVVNWNSPAGEVARTIRAYDPKPGAFTKLNGNDVKLFGPRVVPLEGVLQFQQIPEPGTVISVQEGVVVMCTDTALRVQDVQPAGKSRMHSAEWARGRGVSVGDRCQV
jgi:methionyl-tRNA formyltransferase